MKIHKENEELENERRKRKDRNEDEKRENKRKEDGRERKKKDEQQERKDEKTKINDEKKIKRNDVTCCDWFCPDVFGPNLM